MSLVSWVVGVLVMEIARPTKQTKVSAMNMKKLGMGSLMLMMVLSMSVVGFAFPLEEFKEDFKEHRSTVRESLTTGDYSLWQTTWNKFADLAKRIAGISEERFEEISTQVQEKQAEREDKRADVDAALDAEDYDAFVVAVQDSPRGAHLLESVDEGNFETFLELREAREAGDHDTAKALAAELGLERPDGRGGQQRGDFGGNGFQRGNQGFQGRGQGLGGFGQ